MAFPIENVHRRSNRVGRLHASVCDDVQPAWRYSRHVTALVTGQLSFATTLHGRMTKGRKK